MNSSKALDVEDVGWFEIFLSRQGTLAVFGQLALTSHTQQWLNDTIEATQTTLRVKWPVRPLSINSGNVGKKILWRQDSHLELLGEKLVHHYRVMLNPNTELKGFSMKCY